MLTDQEIALARASMEFALQHGAQKVRVTLNKSLMELFGMLNGELDKVTHALDRSLQVALFVDGRFGSFSSNRLEEEGLKTFLLDAIDTVRTLQPDPARNLPDPVRTAKDAQTGRELGLYDPAYEELTSDRRREMALGTAGTGYMPGIRKPLLKSATKSRWRIPTATASPAIGGMPRPGSRTSSPP